MQKLYEESNIQAIADAIRSKNGKEDTYKTSEMAAAIEALEGADPNCNGMHIPDEALTLTGSYQRAFTNNQWNWFIEQCGDRVVTEDITDAEYMFYFSGELKEIPFDINLKSSTSPSINGIFYQCDNLESIPYIKGTSGNVSNLFYGCDRLRSIPEDWGDYLDTSYVASSTYGQMQKVFSACCSLRSVPKSLLDKLYSTVNTAAARSSYSGMFSQCYTLDEAKEIPINSAALSGNCFGDCFYQCVRLKDATFAVQEDGTPYAVAWKNQTVDLSPAGYVASYGNRIYILNYNSGITADKAVNSDETYAALKDDADWFACDASTATADTGYAIKYSRYNKTSAVNTINSLPDVSSGSGNTIKFKGAAGSATDGGAINTLTEEEIAVAAAKGWTVSLV